MAQGSLQGALKASRGAGRTNTPQIQGNMLVQPTAIEDDYFEGIVMTGRAKGQTAKFSYGERGLLNKEKLTDEDDKSYCDMEKGGTLRLENVRAAKDGIYQSGYVLTFNGQPRANKKKTHRVSEGLTQFVDRSDENRNLMNVNQLVIAEQKHATTLEGLKDAFIAAFEVEDNIQMFGVDPETKEVVALDYWIGTKNQETGKIEKRDAGEMFDAMVKEWEEFEGGKYLSIIQATLEGSGFSVVPQRNFLVGKWSSDLIAVKNGKEVNDPSIDKTAKLGVNPDDWICTSIGQRLSGSMNKARLGDKAISTEVAGKLADAFKAWADKDDLKKFGAKNAWRNLSDETLTKFFAAHGVNLMPYDRSGWANVAMLEDIRGENDRGVAIKTFRLTSPIPFPPVEACKGLLQDFLTEMKTASDALVENLRTGVTAKAEDAPKADAKAAEAPKAAAKEEAKAEPELTAADMDEEDSIDALFDADEFGATS